jgi:hypothetical protein
MYDAQEFHDYYRLFELENNSPDWPLYKNKEVEVTLRNKAASFGGMISISHFIRAFNELRASGAIKPIRAARPVEQEFTLTAAEYNKIPASTIVRRYRNEPEFKACVDQLIARGEI